MFSTITIRIFSLTQAIALATAQYLTETCVEAGHLRKSAELFCPDGLISNVTVLSGTGKCLERDDRCYGFSPTLLVDQLNCYWLRNCVINWPNEPIIYSENSGKSLQCIGRLPTFMSIRYKCFKPTVPQQDGGQDSMPLFGLQDSENLHQRLLLDVCGDSSRENSFKERSVSPNVAGIIRSHNLYPWDYPRHHRNCVVKLYWKQWLMLFVTVQTLDLSYDDSLVIETGRRKRVSVTGGRTYTFSNKEFTSFNFTVGHESNSGKGFLLCFIFTSNTDKSVSNACDSIMTDGIVQNTEPIADDPFALMIHTEIKPTTHKVPVPELPARCKTKKSERAKQKCAARIAKRGNNRRKNRTKGNKKRRQGKKDRRSHRHSKRST